MRMLERQKCWCIIGTGKGKRADYCLAPEERLEEIDAKQDEIEEEKSQPGSSGNQKLSSLSGARRCLLSLVASLSLFPRAMHPF